MSVTSPPASSVQEATSSNTTTLSPRDTENIAEAKGQDSAANLPSPKRLASLDQFRGYTMFGMLLVNFMGGYYVCPQILKHSHDYCSYADTIMPHFLFAAGFALRLSLTRRMEKNRQLPWGRLIRRILGLALLAVVWYSICDWQNVVERFQTLSLWEFLGYQIKRGWFQTLMHIAVTSLWIIPVITASQRVRCLYALASVLLHVGLSWGFNFHWVNSGHNGIDGGPLGFLTWSVPAIAGTIAYDIVKSTPQMACRKLLWGGMLLMFAAWAASNLSVLYNLPTGTEVSVAGKETPKLAADGVVPTPQRINNWQGEMVELPFMPPPPASQRQWNYWMMSQRSGSATYTTFAAGFSMIVYAVFFWLADIKGWQWGPFRTLGTNSLAAYLLHDIAGWTVSPWFPEDSHSILLTLAGFFCFFLAVYIPCRILERNGLYLRM